MRGQSVNQVRTHFLQLLASVVSHALQALERDNNNELLLLEEKNSDSDMRLKRDSPIFSVLSANSLNLSITMASLNLLSKEFVSL